MKKIAATVLIIAFSFTSAGLALAKDKKEGKVSAAEIKVNAEIKETPAETQEVKTEPSDVKEPVQEVKPKVDEAALEQARKKRETDLKKAKEKLNSQPEWVIYMTSLANKKSMGSDALIFTESKISAKGFSAKGYNQSNCTITVQEDGGIVWETMQVNEKGDRIFWRGELKDSLMQGMISMQAKDGKSQDIGFTTAVPKVTEEKIEPGKDKQTKETPKNKRDKGKK